MAKRSAPEVNAGSMADIAFLLLIFFLVTTTIETDSGLNRKLPPMEDQVDPPIIREKNIFTVLVSKNDQLLVEEELVDIADLRSLAIAFLDNGGGVGDEACDYCQGERNESSSDNPDKAIISLKNDRETSYKVYIAVQNELVAAYNDLRNREFERLFGADLGINFVEAQKQYDDPRTSSERQVKLKPKLDQVKIMYPQKLSEAESTKLN
ncbi:MAG: biopolymer transporter ExbD [Flavobacteriaceae bacterium TMED68]|nr:MAG: biopolymer transporter ExbD [Flavobacteriaceae bacterium TMED68]|tara:strand:+ start:2000 stop:2626 length:627 start_codon:yes stop_codon:yes gene_type:complete